MLGLPNRWLRIQMENSRLLSTRHVHVQMVGLMASGYIGAGTCVNYDTCLPKYEIHVTHNSYDIRINPQDIRKSKNGTKKRSSPNLITDCS